MSKVLCVYCEGVLTEFKLSVPLLLLLLTYIRIYKAATTPSPRAATTWDAPVCTIIVKPQQHGDNIATVTFCSFNFFAFIFFMSLLHLFVFFVIVFMSLLRKYSFRQYARLKKGWKAYLMCTSFIQYAVVYITFDKKNSTESQGFMFDVGSLVYIYLLIKHAHLMVWNAATFNKQ